MSKRLFIIISLFIICTTSSYYYFKPNSRSYIDLAHAHLKENNFAAASEALRPISSLQTPYPLPMYKGYIEQMRGHFLESALYFQTLPADSHIEKFLGQATNAYFENRNQDFILAIDNAEQCNRNYSYLPFFKGLQAYLNADYTQALKAWESFEPSFNEQGTGWMPTVFDHLFPHSWHELHIAHCLAEEGDLLSSRIILEKYEPDSLAALFLGLTYLKEAKHTPFDQRGSYYKLARFYFEKSGKQDGFQREKTLIIPHLQNQTEDLLLANFDQEQQKWSFALIHTLLEWKADQTIEYLATKLTQKMLSQKPEIPTTFFHAVRQEFSGSAFHTLLTQKLLTAVIHDLKNGETDDLYEIWSMVEQLSSAPQSIAKQIASLTSTEVFRTIKQDTQTLTHTRRYLAFLEQLGQSAQEKEALAKELLVHAKLFWQQEHQEKKGEHLMRLATALCTNKKAMKRQISHYLSTLYTYAESSNLIDRLMHIFDAMDYFQINKQKLVTPGKLANHLADAEYLYHAHNYSLAKAHATWVLKLDPENMPAKKLVGLSSFHLGEYGQALCILQNLDFQDEATKKALMLSQAFSTQEQEKHLVRMNSIDFYTDDNANQSQ